MQELREANESQNKAPRCPLPLFTLIPLCLIPQARRTMLCPLAVALVFIIVCIVVLLLLGKF